MALIACNRQAPAETAAQPGELAPNAAPQAADTQDQVTGADPAGPQTGLRQVPLTIHSRNGTHHFTVEIAATPEQQERGLMFRKSLAPDRGMIFPYEPAQEVAFWMKNTLIPLDIVYIRSNGTIARIANAEPMDITPLPSGEPVILVLEIAGGRAAQLGIRAGDKVSWPH